MLTNLQLGEFLSSRTTGPIIKCKASKPYIDSFIESILVLSGKRIETEQAQIPDYFWPETGQWGMRGKSRSIHSDDISLLGY